MNTWLVFFLIEIWFLLKTSIQIIISTNFHRIFLSKTYDLALPFFVKDQFKFMQNCHFWDKCHVIVDRKTGKNEWNFSKCSKECEWKDIKKSS